MSPCFMRVEQSASPEYTFAQEENEVTDYTTTPQHHHTTSPKLSRQSHKHAERFQCQH